MDELSPEIITGQQAPESATDEQETPVSPKQITWLSGTGAVVNGLGIGLLLGLLLGLSISPVVSGVIGTLSGILALLLGLNEKYLDPLKSLRIGAFGVFAVAGILLGLYMRANDPFAPSMKDKMIHYREIGYSDEESRAFITQAIQADTGKTRREASVLYSSTVDAGACEVLQYASAEQPVPELVNTFKEAGGTWKELAETFHQDLPEDLTGKALLSLRDCFCSLASEGNIKINKNDQITRLNEDDPLNKIEKVLSSSGKNWEEIVKKISGNIPETQRKKVYLSIIKVLVHD